MRRSPAAAPDIDALARQVAVLHEELAVAKSGTRALLLAQSGDAHGSRGGLVEPPRGGALEDKVHEAKVHEARSEAEARHRSEVDQRLRAMEDELARVRAQAARREAEAARAEAEMRARAE